MLCPRAASSPVAGPASTLDGEVRELLELREILAAHGNEEDTAAIGGALIEGEETPLPIFTTSLRADGVFRVASSTGGGDGVTHRVSRPASRAASTHSVSQAPSPSQLIAVVEAVNALSRTASLAQQAGAEGEGGGQGGPLAGQTVAHSLMNVAAMLEAAGEVLRVPRWQVRTLVPALSGWRDWSGWAVWSRLACSQLKKQSATRLKVRIWDLWCWVLDKERGPRVGSVHVPAGPEERLLVDRFGLAGAGATTGASASDDPSAMQKEELRALLIENFRLRQLLSDLA
mmetsp:Transcript_26696/g.70097  ORF Transcript_26696/g.70097 Transcript_26696/m.70097 type:complete len:287 (+) Transcript_26696:425-1285(+)